MNATQNILARILKPFTALAHLDPARDWFTLVMLSVMALISIITWNVWAFDQVANGGTIGSSATTTPSLVNQASIDTVHAIFSQRASEEAKYISGTYQFADPSQ